MSKTKIRDWRTWKRNKRCPSCQSDLVLTIDDLYADDNGKNDGRLIIRSTCEVCGEAIDMNNVSDIIRDVVLQAI